jgi:hypothetical protein
MSDKKLVLEFYSDQERDEALMKMYEILVNLRKCTKVWEEKYGETKMPKKMWEKKADEFIASLKIVEEE